MLQLLCNAEVAAKKHPYFSENSERAPEIVKGSGMNLRLTRSRLGTGPLALEGTKWARLTFY